MRQFITAAQYGGYSGDGDAAITASLNNPEGVKVDGQGDIFVADSQNNRIRKINPFSGPILTQSNITTNNSGIYRVIITGASGSVTSSVAQLTVIAPPTGSIIQNQNSVNITWGAVSGLVYQVQYATNLIENTWYNIGGPILASNGVITMPDGASTMQRFYRVSVSP